jgi:hypothetical protein
MSYLKAYTYMSIDLEVTHAHRYFNFNYMRTPPPSPLGDTYQVYWSLLGAICTS